MRRKNVWIVAGMIICVGATLSTVSGQAMDMMEGKWEHTMEMKMEGMPGVPAMPFTNTQCMTQKNLIPQNSNKNSNCEILEQRITGNKVVWKIKCIEKGAVSEGEGEIAYSGTTYSGTQRMKVTEKSGQVMNMTMKMKGRRIGNCD